VLRCRRFTTVQQLHVTVHVWLVCQPKTFYSEAIREIVRWWTECIVKQGDCVHKLCGCKISALVFINVKHTVRIIIDSPSHIYIYISSTTWRVLVPALQRSQARRTFTDILQVDSPTWIQQKVEILKENTPDRCSDPQKWYKPRGWFYHKPLLSSKSGLQSQKRERSKGTERYKIITEYRRGRFQ